MFATITWSISPEIFSIGPIHIRWYGLLFATSFILGFKIMEWIYTKEKKNIDDLNDLIRLNHGDTKRLRNIRDVIKHDNFITAEFGDSVEIKRYGTQDEAYLDAIAGRVDLLLADSIAMDDGFLKTDKGKGWEFVGPGYSDPKYFGVGAGIAVRKSDGELAKLFSLAIKVIRSNGVYHMINGKYFAFDVY